MSHFSMKSIEQAYTNYLIIIKELNSRLDCPDSRPIKFLGTVTVLLFDVV